MKFIPNILTLANAALGCCALFFIAILDFDTATLCIAPDDHRFITVTGNQRPIGPNRLVIAQLLSG